MAELRLQTELKQTLELLLAPRLLQMLKILHLPYAELVEEIDREAEENPVLEVERQDEYAAFVSYLTSEPKVKKEASFEDLPGLENLGNTEKTLHDSLLEQLELEDLSEETRAMARQIIENLDDFGYVIEYPRLRDKLMAEFNVSRPTVDKVLKIVQGFEPEGVGARDLEECLLIQVREHNFESPELEELMTIVIRDHLTDLSEQNFAKVAASLKIPESGVAEIANFIKNNLNPNPGSVFGGQTRHVVPSFAIEPDGASYRLVNLEARYGPRLNLSERYLKMLNDEKTDEKTRAFLKDKIRSAKNLIEDFHKRSETLDKIARKIVGTQADFLNKGAAWLKPLTQKSLADEFGLHPSTISRSVGEKYLQTPRGAFPLKFLCPRGPKGMTVARLKALLQEIVQGENKEHPLSDSQLSEAMKRAGADLDRRTVAYYRKELGIPTAEQRQI